MAKVRLPSTLAARLSTLNLGEQLATFTTGYTPDPQKELQEPSYYDNPVLQRAVWHWAIIWYFFFGGLAAGCYVIASLAALFGSREDRAVTRTGYYLSLLALLPCPPLLIIDLDFLKEVNDRFGHPAGDTVIRSVAETIRNNCREIDFAARYGGEEFTVILPETSLPSAIQVAERIRERIAAEVFSGIGSITASIGVSNYPVNALSKEDLIRVADQALYIAKNGGRDRVGYFNYQMITR